MEKINEAWKNASEELYKAQQESGAGAEGASPEDAASENGSAEDVTDVEFEEVDDDKS